MAFKTLNLGLNIFIGVVFTISGIVKANDIVGFSQKIEEYLLLFSFQFSKSFLILLPYKLFIAIFITVLEYLLGIALLFYFCYSSTLKILILITIFFLLLTFYTAISKKMNCCGCFANMLYLTPWQSVLKNIIILIVLSLLYHQKKHLELNNNQMAGYMIAFSCILVLGIISYTIHYLPIVDLTSFRIGKNLASLTKYKPTNYTYTFRKNGKVIKSDKYPDGNGIEFLDVKIKDLSNNKPFRIWLEKTDCSKSILVGLKLLVIVNDPEHFIDKEIALTLHQIQTRLSKKTEQIFLCDINRVNELSDVIGMKFYCADKTLLREVIRAKVGFVLLKDGVVKAKWNYNSLANMLEKMTDFD